MEEREPILIENLKSAFSLFESELQKAVDLLDSRDKIGIERLTKLDGYNLIHPRGVFGLIYNGDDYITQNDRIKSNIVEMKRDMLIGVASIIRFIDNPGIPISKQINNYNMLPGDYTELACDTLAGIEVINNRPEYERRIIPVRTELVQENNGVWTYLTTFRIPLDFIEKDLRE